MEHTVWSILNRYVYDFTDTGVLAIVLTGLWRYCIYVDKLDWNGLHKILSKKKVHRFPARIKTYRKQSPWTSKGNDIMQTMKRYYSNTMSDAEKQNTINLFLGVFQPGPGQPPIWEREHNSDYYLHHLPQPRVEALPLTQWWSPALLPHLPRCSSPSSSPSRPKQLMTKGCSQLAGLQAPQAQTDDFYRWPSSPCLTSPHLAAPCRTSPHRTPRPFELTVLHELYAFTEINHSVGVTSPNHTAPWHQTIMDCNLRPSGARLHAQLHHRLLPILAAHQAR